MADIQEELGTAPGSLDGRQGEITELGWVEGRSGQSKYRFTVTCPRVTPEAESLVSGGMLRWILFSRAICIFMKFCFNPGLGLKGNTVSSWAELCDFVGLVRVLILMWKKRFGGNGGKKKSNK